MNKGERVNFAECSIRREEELREIVGSPHEAVIKKTITQLDDHCRRFISISPLLFLATSDEEGRGDVSPRGDEPGFVQVLNSSQLVIPERPGNRRVDSLRNILRNPHVGLIFLIPGMEEVLRINGRAYVIKGNEQDKASLLGIGVEVEECFIHCPRALKHSGIWNMESWPDREKLPSMMEMFREHLKINGFILN
ncbi:MSMEG_1061 family FMN-dependent PPOX-type flavoprotein [Ammoniphilus sp. 3BR4]|uniref:MSMEG_1061 family FMN-dependent PPOX-type flavoprotein n=1 Tax=Ammoniphilus sp. 3BR4 TaxID=3158265 RepID=UPI003467991B